MKPMQIERVDEKLREIYVLLFQVEPRNINDESSPKTIPEWNSLQHLNLILALEEEFNIKVSPDDATRMVSFAEVRRIVLERANGRQSE